MKKIYKKAVTYIVKKGEWVKKRLFGKLCKCKD
jgi:hypothetical protein